MGSLPDFEDGNEDKESMQDILSRPVIDESNFNEQSLATSHTMVNILKLLKSFTHAPNEMYKEMMTFVSTNDTLMKSLLYLSSLPIQLDDTSTCNELEQLQSNITISIQY